MVRSVKPNHVPKQCGVSGGYHALKQSTRRAPIQCAYQTRYVSDHSLGHDRLRMCMRGAA